MTLSIKTPSLHLGMLAASILLFTPPLMAQSQAEMNATAQAEFEKTDQQLNALYKKLLEQGDDADDKRLLEAQRAWLKYVELHMEATFPLEEGENPRHKYGSIYPLEYAMKMTELFKQRIKVLSQE